MRSSPGSLEIGGQVFEWGSRTYVMGIVNTSPESFAGDGLADARAAIEQGLRFESEGADILDVGGQSTRPGFEEIGVEEEIQRVVPVIEPWRSHRGCRSASTPIAPASSGRDRGRRDTGERHLRVSVRRGGCVCHSKAGLPAVIMHNQRGRAFHDVVEDISAGSRESIRIAEAAGLPATRLIVDPGFGFGWTPTHNLEMLRRLGELRSLGLPILVGTSRKSTIGTVLNLEAADRAWGTAATIAISIANGADIVRVHDVAEMVQVCRMSDAIVRATPMS